MFSLHCFPPVARISWLTYVDEITCAHKLSSNGNCLFAVQTSKMRYAAAYYLSSLSGSTPTAKDIERILASVGIDCDAERAQCIVSSMAGKQVDSIIELGELLLLTIYRVSI